MAASIGPTIGIDGELKFRQSLTNISAALKVLDAQMKNVTSSFSANDSAQTKNAKKLAQLTKQLHTLEAAQAKAKENIEQATQATGENSTATLKAQRQYEEISERINEARDEMRDLTPAFSANAAAADSAADSLESYAKAMATMQAARAALDVLHKIGDGIKSTAESSIEFESAFTGVRRAVKGTEEQLAGIEAAIKRTAAETGVSSTEIAEVVTSAGRLGIATENVMSFSRVMIDLGEASSMSADEAATALARMTNILGTAPENISRLGSALLKLGNSFATNESEITEMATRLASAGKLAGFTETQILGLATAMSSVGINAEAGGTAMTQTLNAITRAVSLGGDKLDAFARVAGMSAEEFARAWRTDASGALQTFVQGLAAIEAQGGNVTLTLDSLGLSGIRQSNMLRALALASDMMADTIKTANDAWTENTELAKTAGLVYGNTEHRISAAREAMNNLGIAIGDAFGPQIRGGADMINDLAQSLTAAAETAPGLVSTLGTVAAAVTATTAAFVALKTAATVLNTIGAGAAALGPWAAVGAAIGLITAGVTTGKAKWNEYVDSMMPVTRSMEDVAAEIERIENRNKELDKILEEGSRTAKISELRREYALNEEIHEKLMQEAADYAAAQTGVTVAIDENTVAVALAAEKEAQFQEIMGGVTELLQKQQARYEELRESYAKTFGLFETAPELVRTSVDDMLAALKSQETYWNEMGANMQAAAQMGIDDGLLQSLATLGVQGAGYLASIMAEIDELGADSEAAKARIAELNTGWENTQSAREQAARDSADAITQASGETEEMIKKLGESLAELDKTGEMYTTAQANIEDYLAGLEAQAGPMYEAVKAIGEKILSSMQAGINSGTLTLPGVSYAGINIDGSHKTGLDYVPYDDYVAVLHKGEMVLPADDAASYRSGGRAGGSSTVINLYAQQVDDATIDYIYNRFSVRMGAEA